ncbi:MAG TPA: hypothetical protein VHA56_18635 [Mucilaginibacter sp.]|nr:hypothetical protein [Mucilaginibacter sp.]
MELQHTHTQRHLQQKAANTADRINEASKGFNMKQLIFWIMIVLAFICIISLGMIAVNFSLHTRV